MDFWEENCLWGPLFKTNSSTNFLKVSEVLGSLYAPVITIPDIYKIMNLLFLFIISSFS